MGLISGTFKYYITTVEGGRGLTENAEAADPLKGGGFLVKVDDAILEHIS